MIHLNDEKIIQDTILRLSSTEKSIVDSYLENFGDVPKKWSDFPVYNIIQIKSIKQQIKWCNPELDSAITSFIINMILIRKLEIQPIKGVVGYFVKDESYKFPSNVLGLSNEQIDKAVSCLIDYSNLFVQNEKMVLEFLNESKALWEKKNQAVISQAIEALSKIHGDDFKTIAQVLSLDSSRVEKYVRFISRKELYASHFHYLIEGFDEAIANNDSSFNELKRKSLLDLYNSILDRTFFEKLDEMLFGKSNN